MRITQIYAKIFRKIYKLFLWIPDIREIYIKLFTNITKLFINYSQISEKNINIHVGWAYTVHTTCIPLELYTGIDAGVHGPTTDVRACILDDRDLKRWSTSM